jgi:hypothetical protein
MKASDKFKTVIEEFLNNASQGDTVFAQHYAKASKNLESCFNYIGSEVKKTGLCAFDDQEIFDMAVRYYTDDSIGQPQPVNCKVVVKEPAVADLFTSAPEVPQNIVVAKTVVTARQTESKTLTLFDL